MSRTAVSAVAWGWALALLPTPALGLGVDDALQVRIPKHPRLSPDGRTVAATVDLTDGDRRRRHLWVAPADNLASGRLGLELDPASGAPTWSPSGQWLAVSVRAEKRPQVALIDPKVPTKPARLLTRLPTGGRDPVWSPDGRWVAFESRVYPDCATTACQRQRLADEESRSARIYEQDAPRRWTRWRDGRSRHLFVVPARGGTARDVTPHPAPALAQPSGPNPRWIFVDGHRLVYVGEAPDGSRARAVDTDLHLVDLNLRVPAVRLTESPGRDFSPALGLGGRVLYLSSGPPLDRPVPMQARVLSLRTFESRPVLVSSPDPIREVVPFGPGALMVVDRTGHRPLVYAPLGSNSTVDRIPSGTVEGIHASASRIAVVASKLDQPPEIVVLEPDGRPLSRSTLNAELPGRAVAVREVRARRPDGIDVHGFLVAAAAPASADDQAGSTPARRPTLVLIHGGPQSAWTDGWHPRWNAKLFASAGFTVLLPNLAGSVGYGRRFADRVRESWGGAPFSDLNTFVDAASAWPEVGQPIALAGASFGGYLVGWSLAKSDRFACGVSHAGVFDPAALWGETDARWFPEWEFGGPPWAPGAVYNKWSPAKYAHHIRAPMLLTHGERDFRVPVEQSLRLFATLKRRNMPVRLLHLPNEGHFIRDPEALRTWHGATLDFLRGCLGRTPTALSVPGRR